MDLGSVTLYLTVFFSSDATAFHFNAVADLAFHYSILRLLYQFWVSRNDGDPQGFVSGSAWIRINLSCLIRIRIRIADPDPGGQK
jgi:hypothetical protein